MRIFLLLLGFLAISGAMLGQGNKEVHGYLHDRYTYEPIVGALIITDDSAYRTYSDSTGFYSLVLPKWTKYLHIRHERYEPEMIRLYRSVSGLNVRIYPLNEFKVEYGELQRKNSLSWLPLKHIWGALGLRYERYIGAKYSVGLYADWYYNGQQYFGEEEYTGFKATPTFRYFLRHNKATGFYLQASAIIGYFDFPVLNYVDRGYSGYSYSVSDNFWTGGAGAAVGGYFAYGRSRRVILDMQIGIQIMPANYPMSMSTPRGVYVHYPAWWYIAGPGSVVEIKISIGGIF